MNKRAYEITQLAAQVSKMNSEVEAKIKELENAIKPLLPNGIKEDFGIFFQPSDGFVFEYDAMNIMMSDLLRVINSGEKLTKEKLRELVFN